MPKKNETELIKCSKNRYLTAKALKFKSKCIKIIADQHGLTRYHAEIKPIKEKFNVLYDYLIIDKKMNLEQIKELIKNRKLLIKN